MRKLLDNWFVGLMIFCISVTVWGIMVCGILKPIVEEESVIEFIMVLPIIPLTLAGAAGNEGYFRRKEGYCKALLEKIDSTIGYNKFVVGVWALDILIIVGVVMANM